MTIIAMAERTNVEVVEPSYGLTGLVLPDGMPYDEWTGIGSYLGTMEVALPWWVGDWLNYGERAYGEKYAQAIQETGRRRQTLANYAYVASRVEPSRRRDTLSWSAHSEVASLTPAKQDKILDEAERREWGSRDIREAVKRLKNAVPASPAVPKLVADTEPATAEAEEEPPAPDLVIELQEADRTIRTQQAELESLRSDDQGSEIAKLHDRMARMEGRVQQMMTQGNERERIIKAQRRTLEAAAQLLGVASFGEIVPALQDVLR